MDKNIKFEDAMARLEAAVKALESGNLSLDESIALYEESIGLVRICHDRLEDCEIKVRQLTEGIDGAITDIPFLNENEN